MLTGPFSDAISEAEKIITTAPPQDTLFGPASGSPATRTSPEAMRR
jgi:hypothetical protein